MKDGINVLSLFDGIGTGQLALKHLGFKINNVVAYEIGGLPKSIAVRHFPDTNYRGDVRDFNVKDFDFKFDLVMGGSSCQNMSNAMANREGIVGSKSSIFFEFVRILKSVRPKYFLFENVGSMSKDDEVIINQMLGCEPIKINSKDYSPALRNRYYWTNIKQENNNTFKNDININDILEDGWYSDRSKARALLASDSRPLTSPIKMMHRYINKGFTTIVFRNDSIANILINHFKTHYKGLTAKELDEYENHPEFYNNENIRYLNQRELESCMTIPHGYTDELTRNKSAHVLGNGWTCLVIMKLLDGMEVERIL